jgi:hypothetical protein
VFGISLCICHSQVTAHTMAHQHLGGVCACACVCECVCLCVCVCVWT